MPLPNEVRGIQFHEINLESIGAAGVAGNLPAFRAPAKCQIVSAALVPSAAITADPTNNSIYTLTRHTAGAAATPVATRSWAAGNSVALTEEAMTLSGTAANLLLAAADTLSVVKTVGGTGLVIPNLLLVVGFRWTGV